MLPLIKPPENLSSPYDSKLPQLLVALGLESLLVRFFIASSRLRLNMPDPASLSLSWLLVFDLVIFTGIAFLVQASMIKKKNWQSKSLAPLHWLGKSPALVLSILLSSFIILLLSLSELSDPGDVVLYHLMN